MVESMAENIQFDAEEKAVVDNKNQKSDCRCGDYQHGMAAYLDTNSI